VGFGANREHPRRRSSRNLSIILSVITSVGGVGWTERMASSSVSQEDAVEKDFQLLSRRSKIRTARARNPLAFISQRPGITSIIQI